jgi:RimJ/RimL family protein N-acetyltransferase
MIEKGKIGFRAWERSDIESLFKWLNEPEVFRYLGDSFPCKSLEEVESYYEERKTQPYRYMILDVEEETAIGTCRLFNIDWKSRCCELSILIGETTYWGRGYGTDAVELLKDIAFRGLGLNRLELYCFADNLRAVSLYKKCSFQNEGVLRQKGMISGSYVDVLIMSVIANEYFTEDAN